MGRGRLSGRKLATAVRRASELFFGASQDIGAALAVAVDRHPAGDRHTVSELERAIRRRIPTNAVEEVLHVRRAVERSRLADDLGSVRPIDLLRRIANLLASGDGAVGSEHIFGHCRARYCRTRIPRDKHFFRLHHRDIHRVRNFAAILPEIEPPASQ